MPTTIVEISRAHIAIRYRRNPLERPPMPRKGENVSIEISIEVSIELQLND